MTLHPYTPITCALCFMVILTVCNNARVSVAGLVLVLVLAIAFRRRTVLIATVVMGVPAAVSFSLMYGLFGQWQSAAELSIRFAAILSGGLLFFSFVDSDTVLRAMSPRVPAPVVFILGSIARMRQLAQLRLQTIRQIQQSRGVKVRRFSWSHVLLPLIVGMITDAAERSRPLQRTGIARPGPRTVLYPVDDSTGQRIVRWILVAVTAVICVNVMV